MGLLDQITDYLSQKKGELAQTTLGDLAQGANRGFVTGLLGGPVDIANTMMGGAGGHSPVMGSDWIGNKLQTLGMMSAPPQNIGGEAASFAGSMVNPSTPLALLAKLGAAGKGLGLAQIAFHGSPYKFDKFDMSKIGTGEGAQVYGHGLYFAENKNVADMYKTALSKSEIADANGKVLYSPPAKGDYSTVTSPEHRAMSALQYAHDTQSSSPYALAYNTLRRNDDAESAKAAQDVLLKWQEAGAVPRPQGSLYKVDIPDEHVARMLDWDKPLSEQPANVQSALRDAYIKRGFPLDEAGNPASFASNPDGESLHAWLASSLQGKGGNSAGQAGASSLLQSLGIPGIKYLDQGSRNVGNGTSNFVVFDDKLPKILGVE